VFCSVACQSFFFPVGQGFFSYFCAPRILQRMCNTPWNPLHFRPLNISQHKPRRRALHPPHMLAHELRRQHTNTPGLFRAPNTCAGLATAGDGPFTFRPLPRPPAPTNTLSRCRRYRRRRQPALPDSRLEHAPPVLPIPAAEQKQVSASLARRPLKFAQAPPATQTPAAPRPARCPP